MAEPTLPTPDEVAQLSRWAQVAFAARCARRALPIVLEQLRGEPEEHRRIVTRATEIAEQSAAAGSADALIAAVGSAMASAAADEETHENVVLSRACASSEDFTVFAFAMSIVQNVQFDRAEALKNPHAVFALAANAAFGAGTIASMGANPGMFFPGGEVEAGMPDPFAGGDPVAKAGRMIAECVANASEAATHVGVAVALTRADFQQILEECRRAKWTDTTPVPASVFAPL